MLKFSILTIIFIIGFFTCSTHAQAVSYQSIQVVIEPLSPAGLRVSIPHYNGILYVVIDFAFQNMKYGGQTKGTIKRENGRWVYLDRNIRFNVGSIISCRVKISFYNRGDYVINQRHVVREFYNINGNNNNNNNNNNNQEGLSWSSKVIVQPFTPVGLRIALTNRKGLSSIKFKVRYENFNGELNQTGQSMKFKGGYWVYEDRYIRLNRGAIIHCTIDVMYEGSPFTLTKDHTVTEYYDSNSPISIGDNNSGSGEDNGGGAGGQYPLLGTIAFQALTPAGIRISIPHETGISAVVFELKYEGVVGVQQRKSSAVLFDGNWVYLDQTTRFRVGSIIHCAIELRYRGEMIYAAQDHVVTELVIDGESNGNGGSENEITTETTTTQITTQRITTERTTTESENSGENNGGGVDECKNPSITQIYESSGSTRNPCSGELIFDDSFRDANTFSKQWTVSEYFSGSPDFEFVAYRNSYANYYFGDKLTITPKLVKDEFSNDYIRTGDWVLPKCTKIAETGDCHRQGHGWNVLPPITSARLSTKQSFNFEYGRIKVIAKLPQGDWIYPLIMLEPTNAEEDETLKNVQIRVASSSGNTDLRLADGRDYSGKVLWGGITGLNPNKYLDHINENTTSTSNYEPWSNDFHQYEMVWNKNQMLFKIDGDVYGRIPNYVPANKSFYVTLGVAAGGLAEFPDKCLNSGEPKPWRNIEAKAHYNFYLNTDTWSKTWNSGSTMEVKSVRIWAL